MADSPVSLIICSSSLSKVRGPGWMAIHLELCRSNVLLHPADTFTSCRNYNTNDTHRYILKKKEADIPLTFLSLTSVKLLLQVWRAQWWVRQVSQQVKSATREKLSANQNRQHQTTLTRFRTGHLKPWKIENNNKIYPTCSKWSLAPAAPEHILACIRCTKQDLWERLLLIIKQLEQHGLMELVKIQIVENFWSPWKMAISEPKSAHLREVLLFAFNWKKSATEAHRMLEEVYGEHALSKSQCYRWFKKFQSGDLKLDNESHGKLLQKFEEAELLALLDEDSTQTQEKLAKQLQVSQGAVSLRLNSLGMTQKLSRWVPHKLSERQQERRLVSCEGLLARHEKKSFLHRIVTSDEKWIHFSNPMRQKSWSLPGQFPKQMPRPNRFGKKAMLCVWWDQTGVVYFELLKPGQTVNTSRYEQQMHRLNEKRPEWREKHNKLILKHDNAPAHNATVVKNTMKDHTTLMRANSPKRVRVDIHFDRWRKPSATLSCKIRRCLFLIYAPYPIKDLGWELLPHPPYSPDLAPSDYHLFTSLGHALKKQEFSNSDILRKWLVDWFDSKEIEFFRQGI
ncbi:SETMAR [Cordylochernes scorpioides]|uniref:SETMAR n=1 Tax=Cordylochernes scorpioides TaxID=51811 RepID=A0ABY6K0V0_9ARAC|nr:SETMAR [Cordylochernes scorpioides]